MSASHTDRAAELFDQALELTPDQRRRFLAEECGEDLALLREVEALIAADDTAGAFLSNPQFNPADVAVRVANSESPGSRIGHYKLVEMIGEGGFGSVFLAEQERPVKRRVALKIIKLGMDTRQVIARFEAERQALALMDHPNIARVLDAGATEAGRPYFVMELVRGTVVTRYCRQNNLSLRDRLRLFIPVCQAIQHAHQKGIIHRDLKPSNVLITLIDGEPVPKIIDFGIAKATQQRLTDRTIHTEFHGLIGTPAYMSPEQATLSGDDVDTRSDVYSLGVMLYELLTGTTPFDPKTLANATYAEVQRMIREVEPPRPSTRISTIRETVEGAGGAVKLGELRSSLRGELDWIVMKCLEKQRSRRYESASALAKDIEAFLAGKPVQAAPPSRVYQVRKFVQQHRWAITSAAAIVTALAIGLGISLLTLNRLRIEQARTIQEKQEAERQRRDAQTSRDAMAAVNEFVNNMLASADPETSRTGKPVTVQEVLDQAASQIGGKFKNQPLVEAGIRDTIGRAFASIGKQDDASQNLLIAEELRSAAGIAEDPSYLTSRAEMAISLHSTGEIEKSQKWFIAVVEQAEKQLSQSESEIVPAVDVLAKSATYIGVPHARLEKLFRVAYERRRVAFGEDDPATLLCRSSYAWHVASLERPVEAESMLRDTLTRMQRVLGPADKYTLRTQDRLATLLRALSRGDEALAIARAAAEAAESAYGFEHPLTMTAWRDYCECLQSLRRYAEMLPILEKRLAAIRTLFGPESSQVVPALQEIANTYERLGDYQRAFDYHAERLPLSRKLYGDTGLQTLLSQSSMGQLLSRMNRHEEALIYFDGILPPLRAQVKADSPTLARVLDSKARALLQLNRKEEALAVADEVLTIVNSNWPRANPVSRPDLFRRTAAAAMIQSLADSPAAAEPALRLALTRADEVSITSGSTIRELLAQLVVACEESGNAAEADLFRQRLAKITPAPSVTQPAEESRGLAD